MDLATFSQLIGSLGFPIAISIYLVYVNERNNRRNNEENKRLAEVINNNTLALTKLTERVGLSDLIKNMENNEK